MKFCQINNYIFSFARRENEGGVVVLAITLWLRKRKYKLHVYRNIISIPDQA
jgi:hypothetical protein